MNEDNSILLKGELRGPAWTRWKSRERGQVRFWLAVSRDLAGAGLDVFLVVIEPKTADEVFRLERELSDGRTMTVHAHARSMVDADRALTSQEDHPGVIFVAEDYGFDGAAATQNAHRMGLPPRRHHAHGKMAAAGDIELPLEASR